MSSKTINYFLEPRKTNCYTTFDVLVGDETIGCIQQVDASSGVTSHKNPRDLWLVWIGDPHNGNPNGPDAHPKSTKAEAIHYILRAGAVEDGDDC